MSWNAILKLFSTIGRWGGRATALLLLLFWGVFFVEHLMEWFLRAGGRYPPPWVWGQQFFHFVMLVGLGMMVRWERLGAVVMLVATVAFFAGIHPNTFPWIALINLLPIGCFGLYWLAGKKLQTTGADAQGLSRPQKLILGTVAAAFTAFILLCANEMLGNPPLMTAAWHPSSALVGSWQAKADAWPGLPPIEVLLTVNGDGTVSGKIDGATLTGARITANRTWFGRALNWRTDYLVLGELSGTTGAPPLRNASSFAAPVNRDGQELVGSIFTSGHGAGGKGVSSGPLVSRLRLKKM